MKSKKRTTIFKQLLISIILPAFIGFIVLGIINYYRTKSLSEDTLKYKNEVISNEIRNILEFQDMAFEILEENLNNRMSLYSNLLINNHLKQTSKIKDLDLSFLQTQIGLHPPFEDIYIIDTNGIVVNTTFRKDLKLNLFSFGESHKKMLLNVFDNDSVLLERFTIESQTKRLKKYSYQPTIDGNYIVELGFYSKRADQILDFIKNRLADLSHENKNIMSISLFVGADQIFPLNQIDTNFFSAKHLKFVEDVFSSKTNRSIYVNENGKKYHYEYIFMERKNTKLYKNAVISIITDRQYEIRILRNELVKSALMFMSIIIVIILLIYHNAKLITRPIEKFEYNLNRISSGFIKERAEIVGNNEITTLSEHYNLTLDQLEVYYNEIECANTQLEYLIDSLELRIETEVKKNREKDLILSQQSGMIALGEITESLSNRLQKPLYNINKLNFQIIEDFKNNNLTKDVLETRMSEIGNTIKFLSQTLHDFKFFFAPDKTKQNFSVKDVVEKALTLLSPKLEKNKIELQTALSDEHYVSGYPSEYTQAIINILNNSIDIINERKIPKPQIAITLHFDDEKSCLSIKDNGGGIPDIIIESIFDPNISTKTENEDNKGLGLYIAKIIIENKMEGKIEAYNTEDGAEFKIIL